MFDLYLIFFVLIIDWNLKNFFVIEMESGEVIFRRMWILFC